jgi:hypothetical protein
MEPQGAEGVRRRISKWASLGERVAKLKEGESIVLESEGDSTEEASLIKQACKIRTGLNGLRVCRTVRRAVQVVDGKIVITRVGSWPMLSAFKDTAVSAVRRARPIS